MMTFCGELMCWTRRMMFGCFNAVRPDATRRQETRGTQRATGRGRRRKGRKKGAEQRTEPLPFQTSFRFQLRFYWPLTKQFRASLGVMFLWSSYERAEEIMPIGCFDAIKVSSDGVFTDVCPEDSVIGDGDPARKGGRYPSKQPAQHTNLYRSNTP